MPNSWSIETATLCVLSSADKAVVICDAAMKSWHSSICIHELIKKKKLYKSLKGNTAACFYNLDIQRIFLKKKWTPKTTPKRLANLTTLKV